MLSNQGTSNQFEFYNVSHKPQEKDQKVIDIDLQASEFKKRAKFEIYKN